MVYAEGGARWKAHFDNVLYERDPILKEIDVRGDYGQTVLKPVGYSSLRREFDSLKEPYNKLRYQLQKLKRDVRALEDTYTLTNNSVLPDIIKSVQSKVLEVQESYDDVCNKISFSKRKLRNYSRLMIPDIKPISGVVIDRMELKEFFVPYTSTDSILYLNDVKPDDYQNYDDFKDAVKRKIKLMSCFDYYQNDVLPRIYDMVSANPHKYGVESVTIHRDTKKEPWLRLDFESGLGLLIKMVFPFTKKYIFNLITYSKYSNVKYNLVWEQDNYQCLTSCLNRISEDLFGLYSELVDIKVDVSTGESTTNNLFDNMNSLALGYSIYNLFSIRFSKLLVNRMEVHKNLRFPDARKQKLFHKGQFMFVTSNDKFCNWVKGTAYIQYPHKPKIRIYNKTLELFEKQDVKINEHVSRIELDMTKDSIGHYCSTHSLCDIGYYHPEDVKTPDMSIAHFRELFNKKIMKLYRDLNPFENFLEYVRIMGDSRWQGIDLTKGIPGEFIENYTLWDLLSDVSLDGSFYDLLTRTGIKERTLSRKLGFLSKNKLIVYNRSLKSYYLTNLGALCLSEYTHVYALFYAVQKEYINDSSNTVLLQTPQDAPRILEAILIECMKSNWGDPPNG